MANVWEFSPDAGTTKYDITDLQGRDDIDGINLLDLNLADMKTNNTYGTWSNNVYTADDVTWTVNTNGTIIANGTQSISHAVVFCELTVKKAGNYKLTGCPVGGSDSKYFLYLYNSTTSQNVPGRDYGSGVTVYLEPGNVYRVLVWNVANNVYSNAVFKAMLTKADLDVSGFIPYNQQSIQHQINNITGVTGVRNLLPNTAITTAQSGVTFTVNSDGTVSLSNATSTSEGCNFEIGRMLCKAGVKYQLNGMANLNTGNIKLRVGKLSSESASGAGTADDAASYDGGYTASKTGILSYSTDQWVAISINIQGNTPTGGATFKPMIRLASDPDDTYVPYAMTNRELTKVVTTVDGTITTSNTNVTLDNTYTIAKKSGKTVMFKVRFSIASAFDTGQNLICTLPYAPAVKYPTFSLRNRNTPYNEICGCYLDTGVSDKKDLKVNGYSLPAGSYDIVGMYMCV